MRHSFIPSVLPLPCCPPLLPCVAGVLRGPPSPSAAPARPGASAAALGHRHVKGALVLMDAWRHKWVDAWCMEVYILHNTLRGARGASWSNTTYAARVPRSHRPVLPDAPRLRLPFVPIPAPLFELQVLCFNHLAQGEPPASLAPPGGGAAAAMITNHLPAVLLPTSPPNRSWCFDIALQ